LLTLLLIARKRQTKRSQVTLKSLADDGSKIYTELAKIPFSAQRNELPAHQFCRCELITNTHSAHALHEIKENDEVQNETELRAGTIVLLLAEMSLVTATLILSQLGQSQFSACAPTLVSVRATTRPPTLTNVRTKNINKKYIGKMETELNQPAKTNFVLKNIRWFWIGITTHFAS